MSDAVFKITVGQEILPILVSELLEYIGPKLCGFEGDHALAPDDAQSGCVVSLFGIGVAKCVRELYHHLQIGQQSVNKNILSLSTLFSPDAYGHSDMPKVVSQLTK